MKCIKEDRKLKQRVKRNWYQLGDRNTKFFNVCAYQTRRKNFIKGITIDPNSVYNKVKDIEEAFRGYFAELLTAISP